MFTDGTIEMNRAQFKLLVAFLVRDEEVLRVAADRLDPSVLLDGHIIEAHIYGAALRFFKEHEICPSRDALVGDVCASLEAAHFADEHILGPALVEVDRIYKIPESSLVTGHGLQLLEAFLNCRLRLAVAEQIGLGVPTQEVMEYFRQEKERATVTTPPLVDPFADGTDLTFVPRSPTGLSFFDDLIGGGTRPGELYGILAGTGGGKTTLAIQLAVSLARQHEHVLFFSYEQPDDGEFRIRLYSCASGLPRRRFERKAVGADDAVKSAVADARKALAGYLRVVDRSSRGDTVHEIESVVAREAREGRLPRLVVVDWLLPLVHRVMAADAASGNRTAFREMRHYVQHAVDQLKHVASRHDTSIVIFHQLSVEQARRSAKAKPQWFNSAEAGSFAWYTNACIAIGTPDKSGFCTAIGSKVRSGPRSEIVVRLRGDRCRFEDPDSEMAWDNAQRRYVPADEVGKMPGVSATSVGDNTDDVAGLPGVMA